MVSKIKPIPGKWFLCLLKGVVLILVVTIFFSACYYPETYNFFREPISRLGGILSTDFGEVNVISQWMFISGFVACGVLCGICFIFAIINGIKPAYRVNKSLVGYIIFTICIFFMMIGAFGTAFPYDGNYWIHLSGVGTFLVSFLLFNILAQCHSKKRRKSKGEADKWEKTVILLIFVFSVLYLVTLSVNKCVYEETNMIFLFLDVFFQKLSLTACFIAIFLLDPDDMLFPLKKKPQRSEDV